MHQLVYYYMSTTFTVPVALHHQAWSGPDTRWWLSPRTGTCFVSTSLLEVQEPPSSTGSGGLWTTCILFCHLNVCLKTHTGYEIWIFASLIGTTRIWRRRKSRKPEGFFCRWHGDFILGTTLPLHFHVISSCLHNIYAITIILPPLAWHLCWNLVHLECLISSGCYQNLRTFLTAVNTHGRIVVINAHVLPVPSGIVIVHAFKFLLYILCTKASFIRCSNHYLIHVVPRKLGMWRTRFKECC